MNKIDLIEIKALTPNRYVVKVKNHSVEEKITVLSETLIDLGIFKPCTLSNDEYQVLKASGVIDELKNKAIHFVSFQARLTSEVVAFLEKKDASKKQISQIIRDFKEANLLDDDAYVKAYIDRVIRYEFDGPFKVREKLLKKGAAQPLIEQYLVDFNDEVQRKKVSELLTKELQYKMKKPLNKMIQSLKQRFMTKGFVIHVIESVLEEYKEDIRMQIDEEYLLNQELKKMPIKMFDKNQSQKLIAKLMRQGFSYQLIKEKIKGGNFDETIE